jgi:lipid II:glycine glycyltransferase (peptidoglycan interpeptide bridge formation enzyme)
MVLKEGTTIKGLLPLLLVRSRLTGTRLTCLPFSDVCYPLVNSTDGANTLLQAALDLAREKRVGYIEVRGAPRVDEDIENVGDVIEKLGYHGEHHFKNYTTPLCSDANAVFKTFKKKFRTLIRKSFRDGVRVRLGKGEGDIDEFYRLYLLNRRYHGIPPQPREFFSLLFNRMKDESKALLYISEFESHNAAAIIALRFNGVCYAKYEGVDHTFRKALPVHPILWQMIEDAANDGEKTFDFGRTAIDNVGLNQFKNRWGTTCIDLPYYFHPPQQGLSVVKTDSLKYKLFTGLVKRLPLSINARIGARLFRHFG